MSMVHSVQKPRKVPTVVMHAGQCEQVIYIRIIRIIVSERCF